jgi:N-acetylglucosaminyl-diphospho-decaprenol L-rhamnosyltransferase
LVLTNESITALCERLESDVGAGLVGPQLVDSAGTPQASARAFPTIGRSWRQAFVGLVAPRGSSALRYAQANRDLASRGGEVDWVTGACFLVRRQAFIEVGGFDSSYFMYVEEVDLCWRLKQAGWRVLHEPSASVVHIGGVSASQRPFSMAVAQHRSLWRFSRITARGRQRWALPLVAVGITARLGVVLARELLRRSTPRQLSGRASPRSGGASAP